MIIFSFSDLLIINSARIELIFKPQRYYFVLNYAIYVLPNVFHVFQNTLFPLTSDHHLLLSSQLNCFLPSQTRVYLPYFQAENQLIFLRNVFFLFLDQFLIISYHSFSFPPLQYLEYLSHFLHQFFQDRLPYIYYWSYLFLYSWNFILWNILTFCINFILLFLCLFFPHSSWYFITIECTTSFLTFLSFLIIIPSIFATKWLQKEPWGRSCWRSVYADERTPV